MAKNEVVEYGHSLAYDDRFSNLDAQGIYEIGQYALGEANIGNIYARLSQSAPPSEDVSFGMEPPLFETWYDRLIGVQHRLGFHAISIALDNFFPEGSDAACDLATGTGNGAYMLTRYTNHVTAVDIVRPLLDVSDRKLALAVSDPQRRAKSYEVINANIIDLNLDRDFNIVLCQGIYPYLRTEERSRLRQTIDKIIKPNGIFAEYRFKNDQFYTQSERAKLVGIVVEIILRRSLRYTSQFQASTTPLMAIEGYATNGIVLNRLTNYGDILEIIISQKAK